MNLAAINWRSPIVWVVIVGGGIAVYLLFRHFQSQNAQNAAPTAPRGEPDVGTSLFLQNPPPPPPHKKPPHKPPKGKSITYSTGVTIPPGGLDFTPSGEVEVEHIVQQEYGFAQGSEPNRRAIEAINTFDPGSNFTPETEPKREFILPQVDPTTGMLIPTPKGGGVPDTTNHVHISTWPYGGQMVRPRLENWGQIEPFSREIGTGLTPPSDGKPRMVGTGPGGLFGGPI